MKLPSSRLFLVLIFVVGQVSADELYLNVFLPGVQLRYQDTSSQTQEMITHYTYTVSMQFSNRFVGGVEYLTLNESSGNPSFAVDRKFSEKNVFIGYTLFKKDFLVSGQYLLEFMLSPLALMGRSTNDVTTKLLGSSQSAKSSEETTYGLGVIGTVRTGYFILETDFRYQSSNNYEPNSIMMGSVRVGAAFSF